MWKFKDGEEENMKKFLEGLNSLKKIIPEIKYMETGININPKNNYDAILISEFETMEDLEKYKNNPEHVKVSALCKQIRVDRQAIDYEFQKIGVNCVIKCDICLTNMQKSMEQNLKKACNMCNLWYNKLAIY